MLVKPCVIPVTSKACMEFCAFGFSALSLSHTQKQYTRKYLCLSRKIFTNTAHQWISNCRSEVWVNFRADVTYCAQELFHHVLHVLVVAAGEVSDGFCCLLFYFGREVTLGAHHLKSKRPLSKMRASIWPCLLYFSSSCSTSITQTHHRASLGSILCIKGGLKATLMRSLAMGISLCNKHFPARYGRKTLCMFCLLYGSL